MKSLLSRIWGCINDFIYDLRCSIYHKTVKRDPNKPLRMQSQKRKNMVFYIVMLALPMLQFFLMWFSTNINHILLAFKEYDSEMNYTWTLNNFKTVIDNFLHNQELQLSLRNSVLFYLLVEIISLPTSLFIAFYFYKKWKHADRIRLIIMIPAMISSVVTVTCFYYLMDRGYPLLVKLFTGKEVLGLLVNSNTRMPMLLAYNIFYSLAGSFLFYSSAMSDVDDGISDAAKIDGANIFQEFTKITLPMIFPLLSTFIVAGAAGILIGDYGMYAFAQTGGNALPTMGYYFTVYVTQDGAERRFPYFSALGLVLTFFTCIIVFSLRAWLRRFDPFEEKE